MTQQGDMTSRPPGEDASLVGLPGMDPGTASFPAGPAPARPDASAQPDDASAGAAQPAPWWPSPYLAEGEAAPEAYPAPARPGQPKYGTSPNAFQGGRQAGFDQPGFGRRQQAGTFGRPRQASQPRTVQPRDPALASGWERLLAMTVDWVLILAASYLILYSHMERFVHQFNALLASAQVSGQPPTQAAVTNFLTSTFGSRLAFSVVAYGLAIASFWILQATTGATLGKLLVGLRVVSAADRGQAGVRATGLRTAVFLAGPALFTFGAFLAGIITLAGAVVWMADCTVLLTDPQRQSLHDRVAGTLVVRKPRRGRSRTSW